MLNLKVLACRLFEAFTILSFSEQLTFFMCFDLFGLFSRTALMFSNPQLKPSAVFAPP